MEFSLIFEGMHYDATFANGKSDARRVSCLFVRCHVVPCSSQMKLIFGKMIMTGCLTKKHNFLQPQLQLYPVIIPILMNGSIGSCILSTGFKIKPNVPQPPTKFDINLNCLSDEVSSYYACME